MASVADMQRDVVAGGFDPVDFLHRDDRNSPSGPHGKTSFVLTAGFLALDPLQQLAQTALDVRDRGGFQLHPRSLQSLSKADVIDRLEQVIQCVYFECGQGVVIISSEKDDER